ncbi:DUF4861 domain-containing protein [Maribellus comscasis]|uniref:DUF4861 domain-containing protein n=1 Tax=Maribellus comscasis TaxID=2681766 RepID=A0A6I6JIW8_9BACT|nr:DUF4861 domain-containing protein [Maribellus comscasis]QGY42696.1 DUF4861 domain-containing protein [Maribellus comscasis]
MKTNYLLLFLLAAVIFSCSNNQPSITLINPLDVDKPDEVIILSREQVNEKISLSDEQLPVFKSGAGNLVPSQVDDLNGDGNWDEVAVLLAFVANETKMLTIEPVSENEYPSFEKRTNLRLGIIQNDGTYKEVDAYDALPCTEGFEIIAQGESVSWENDKIAFRNYFDCRNVKDLFGKLLPGLIIDKIHTEEITNYHDLDDWGMDVLHCGSSLGSGGIALMRNDSLFRLGSTKKYSYQKLTEGPVRSVFELRYSGWEVDGEMLEAVERISIYPGKYWFESDVTVNGCREGDQIVTGIVTSMLKREPFEFQAGDFQCIGTHDVQSLNNDELGMAVLVPKNEIGKIGRTTDINFFKLGYQTVVEKSFSNIISETYYIGQKCKDKVPAKHYFAAVWGLEKDQWKTEDGFKQYLQEEMNKLSGEIVIQ